MPSAEPPRAPHGFDRLPARTAYRVLESGPIVLMSTRGEDGRFSVDGDTLDLGERMVKWRPLMD